MPSPTGKTTTQSKGNTACDEVRAAVSAGGTSTMSKTQIDANGGQKRSLDNPTDESITKREKVTGTEDGGATKAEAAAASAEDPKGDGGGGESGGGAGAAESATDAPATAAVALAAEVAPVAVAEAAPAAAPVAVAEAAPAAAAAAADPAAATSAAAIAATVTAAQNPASAAAAAAAAAEGGVATEYTMPVEIGLVGSVIGRAGAAIRAVRDATGAQVSVNAQSEAVGGYRQLKIVGTQAQIYVAYGMVQGQLKNGREQLAARAAAGGGGAAADAAAAAAGPAVGETMTTMLVPREAMGGLIGRGGGTIAQLRANSSCAIRLADDDYQGTAQRLVTMTGRPEACAQAQQLIHAKMGENMAAASGALAAGRSSYMPAAGGGAGAGGGGMGGMGGMGGAAGGGAAAGGTTLTMLVPDAIIGRIIGKGGASINELRQSSGARVDIPKGDGASNAGGMRAITLTGSAQQVQLAQHLIGQKQQAADAYGENSQTRTAMPPHPTMGAPGMGAPGAPPGYGALHSPGFAPPGYGAYGASAPPAPQQGYPMPPQQQMHAQPMLPQYAYGAPGDPPPRL